MKKEEAVNFVIQELGKHHSENEITMALCQKTGMTWHQAEQFIHQVQAEHKHTISSHQSPLLIVMGVAFVLIGLGLIFYNLEFIVSLFNKDALGLALSARSVYYRIGSIITGFGMAIGGSIGLRGVISELLDKQG
jgi:hypothetical protein